MVDSGNILVSIGLGELRDHAGNPNRMSSGVFNKLVRNIERSGRYESLVVRKVFGVEGYEIINGHHRRAALAKLGYSEADCLVWDVDETEVDILLSTLNRLGGSDDGERKIALLRRLSKRFEVRELSRLLPMGDKVIEKLIAYKKPVEVTGLKGGGFAEPMMFFVDGSKKEVIERAIDMAAEGCSERTRAKRRAKGLYALSNYDLDNAAK